MRVKKAEDRTYMMIDTIIFRYYEVTTLFGLMFKYIDIFNTGYSIRDNKVKMLVIEI